MTSQNAGAAQTEALRDEAALEAAFQQHYARVFDVLFCLVGDRAEAEDLTLEAFWRLWQNPSETLRRLTGQGDNLSGWLYRVAVRLGYNALRAARRRAKYEEEAGRDALEYESPPDPASEVELAQERTRVRAVLKHMPAREAQLLILRHSGLSYKEVAAVMGIAPASVGTLLARAEREFERRWRDDSSQ